MVGDRFLLNPQDAKRAVTGYTECAGHATATLKSMLSRVDEFMAEHAQSQADGPSDIGDIADIAEELKVRISRLIAQVDGLSSIVQSTDGHYGVSDADIAQIFKTAMNAGDPGRNRA